MSASDKCQLLIFKMIFLVFSSDFYRPVQASRRYCAMFYVLTLALYINCLFVFLLNFFPHLLSCLLYYLMLSFSLIYFLTRLLPDLSIYSFQNKPVQFPDLRS